jgi:hypothetical protein
MRPLSQTNTRQLFEYLRQRVTTQHVAQFAPSDPGYHGYVDAFATILRDGEDALRRVDRKHSLELRRSFEVTETIGLTRWVHAKSNEFRWFRLLTNVVDLLSECVSVDGESHYAIVGLLLDFFALHESNEPNLPNSLLPEVCREAATITAYNPTNKVFATLAELLTSSVVPLDDTTIETLCMSLKADEEQFWTIDMPGKTRKQKLTQASHFPWGITFYNQLHGVWLDMIAQRFPTSSVIAVETKQWLLLHGEKWAKKPRSMG